VEAKLKDMKDAIARISTQTIKATLASTSTPMEKVMQIE
jgi:hypothetical protein